MPLYVDWLRYGSQRDPRQLYKDLVSFVEVARSTKKLLTIAFVDLGMYHVIYAPEAEFLPRNDQVYNT